jgi:DNA-binding NtrC family response regulator
VNVTTPQLLQNSGRRHRRHTPVKSKKILIVDDDLSLKPLWESIFSRKGDEYEIAWAVSCEEALKIVQKTNLNNDRFCLIISDLFLAGSGTGMELVGSDEVAESQAKTVLISVADRNEIIDKFGHMLPGDTQVISKPLNLNIYRSVIEALLE